MLCFSGVCAKSARSAFIIFAIFNPLFFHILAHLPKCVNSYFFGSIIKVAGKFVIERIKEAIKSTGLTQQEFCKKLGFGESNISRWAKGSRGLSVKSLKKIAEATGMPLSYFLDKSEPKNIQKNENKENKNNDVLVINLLQENNKRIDAEINLLKKEIEILKNDIKIIKESVC